MDNFKYNDWVTVEDKHVGPHRGIVICGMNLSDSIDSIYVLVALKGNPLFCQPLTDYRYVYDIPTQAYIDFNKDECRFRSFKLNNVSLITGSLTKEDLIYELKQEIK